jgi:hypothetical protein
MTHVWSCLRVLAFGAPIKKSDPLADEGMVVDRQNPYRFAMGPHHLNVVSFASAAFLLESFSANHERR